MCCIVRYVRSASMLSGTKTNHKSISSHPTSKITTQQNISLAASRPPVGSEMFRTPRGSVSSLLLNIFPRAFEFQLLQSRGLRSLIAFTYAEFGIFSGTLTFDDLRKIEPRQAVCFPSAPSGSGAYTTKHNTSRHPWPRGSVGQLLGGAFCLLIKNTCPADLARLSYFLFQG